MVLEVAILYVKEGKSKDFENDFKKAGQYISVIKGYIRHSLNSCIEQPGKYILLVEWDQLEDHVVGFRQADGYQHWKQLLHHYYDPFPIVEHYQEVILL